MAVLNANLDNYTEQEAFEVLPAGWYEAEVVDSEIKEGSAGPYINWTFAIIGKPNKIWDVMSLGNDISMKRLKTLAVCAGHPNPNFISDTEELHGKRCKVRLKIETDDSGKYDPKNKISAFKPLGKPAASPYPTPAEDPEKFTAYTGDEQKPAPAADPAPKTTKNPWE